MRSERPALRGDTPHRMGSVDGVHAVGRVGSGQPIVFLLLVPSHVEENAQDEHEDERQRGATGYAGRFQHDAWPGSCGFGEGEGNRLEYMERWH